MQEGGAWPYGNEGPLGYPVGGSFHYEEPQRAMLAHLDLPPPDYGPPNDVQGPLSPYNGPPQYGPLSQEYGLPHHNPHSSYNGASSSYFPEDFTFHSGPPPPNNNSPLHGNGYHSHEPAYQYKESEISEEVEDRDEDEEEDDESVIINSLEEALQKAYIQLPRLAVTAPPSVLPPRGGGLCRLPNLGNTCYLNVVLQCLYHTPHLPALLAEACEGLDGEGEEEIVAYALNSLMMRMDDVKKLKKGLLAYFKGVCGLKDEQFASVEQQEAHELLTQLLQWLHQELASQEDVDCACTKSLLKKHSAATTGNNGSKEKYHSTPQSTPIYHHQEKKPSVQPLQQNTYQFQPPISQNHHPNYDIYTGNANSSEHHQQPQYSYGSDFNQQPQYSLGNNHNYDHSNQSQYSFGNNHNHHPQYTHGSNQHLQPNDNHHHRWGNRGHTKLSDQHQNISRDGKMSKSPPQLKVGQEGEVCDQCGVTFQRRSLISDLFEGIRQQDIICPKGGVILNTTWERFTSISLPVSGSSEITLEDVLQRYFRISKLMWDCKFCHSTHLCHQQVRILCPPPILTLHLSRYTDRRNPRKQNVVFPNNGLSLRDHLKSTKGRAQQYDLYGICNHHGTMRHGHYIACCKTNKDKLGSWYEFDDEEISKVTHFKRPREAHILFYSVHEFEARHH